MSFKDTQVTINGVDSVLNIGNRIGGQCPEEVTTKWSVFRDAGSSRDGFGTNPGRPEWDG